MSGPRELLPMAPPDPAAPEQAAPALGAAAERYRIEGMDCASCATTIEKAVAAIEGADRGAYVRRRPSDAARLAALPARPHEGQGRGLLVAGGPVCGALSLWR